MNILKKLGQGKKGEERLHLVFYNKKFKKDTVSTKEQSVTFPYQNKTENTS